MNFLEAIAKIPLPRWIIGTALMLVIGFAVEQWEWWQSVGEHLLNMEALK